MKIRREVRLKCRDCEWEGVLVDPREADLEEEIGEHLSRYVEEDGKWPNEQHVVEVTELKVYRE